MDEEKNTTVYKGVGICDVLFIVFLVLKLIGVIHWSWWWVTAPLWISFGIFIIVAIIAAIITKRG